MEEVGYIVPTNVQREALPVLFSGNDCILHAQVDFLTPVNFSFIILFIICKIMVKRVYENLFLNSFLIITFL